MERSSSRLRVLAFLVALMFVALTTRLWYLQVLASDTYKDTALQNSIRFAYTDPSRGLIVDASGTELVLNQPSLEVKVTRDELGDEAEAVVLRLAELLDVPVADLRESLQDDRYYPYQAVPVAEFVDEPAEPGRASRGERIKLYIQEHPQLFPGVSGGAGGRSVLPVPHARRAHPGSGGTHRGGGLRPPQVEGLRPERHDRARRARGRLRALAAGHEGRAEVHRERRRGGDPGARLGALTAGGRRAPHARDG